MAATLLTGLFVVLPIILIGGLFVVARRTKDEPTSLATMLSFASVPPVLVAKDGLTDLLHFPKSTGFAAALLLTCICLVPFGIRRKSVSLRRIMFAFAWLLVGAFVLMAMMGWLHAPAWYDTLRLSLYAAAPILTAIFLAVFVRPLPTEPDAAA